MPRIFNYLLSFESLLLVCLYFFSRAANSLIRFWRAFLDLPFNTESSSKFKLDLVKTLQFLCSVDYVEIHHIPYYLLKGSCLVRRWINLVFLTFMYDVISISVLMILHDLNPRYIQTLLYIDLLSHTLLEQRKRELSILLVSTTCG